MRATTLALALAGLLALGGALVLLVATSGPGARGSDPGRLAAPGLGTAAAPLAVDLGDARKEPVRAPFPDRQMPAAGLLFDVDSGRVLWSRNPRRRRPIASLTKIMTALVVADRTRLRGDVRITRFDARAGGSAVGALPVGRRVGIETLTYGLMLVSGNDAARALARGAGGSYQGFIRRMNETARLLGMRCSAYTTPNGLRDEGNYSCAADLAAQTRALLRDPRLARIVATRSVRLRWPAKRGGQNRLEIANNNPLLRRYKGVTGLKTGYTRKAGSCYVVTARRGNVHLGVVLLDSPDIDRQARVLLDRGFAASER